MSQPRHHSLAEVCVGTVVGLAINIALQRLVFPWFGIAVPISSNVGIALIFTAVSVVRGYAVRRVFNGANKKRWRWKKVGSVDLGEFPAWDFRAPNKCPDCGRSFAAACSGCSELEEIVRELIDYCEGGRIGTIGADRVYTRQINVKAVERWKRILSENASNES